ncbi:MAG: hypothetical protein WBD20_17555, partial [Pirellulaceae bacterium]
KLHLLSASVLACAVGIFAFVNRDGGRRASAVPEQRSGSAPAGQGFKRQTGLVPPATSNTQTKASSAKSNRQKVTTQRERTGRTLSGPVGFDAMTAADNGTKQTVAALPRFDAPDTSKQMEVPDGKKISLSAKWLDGLQRIDVFDDAFHDQFTSSSKDKNRVRIKDGKLIVPTNEKPIYLRFMGASHQLSPGMAVSIDTSMRPALPKKAAVGLIVGTHLVLLQSTGKGISVRTKPTSGGEKAATFIGNLTLKRSQQEATLCIARDLKEPELIHWALKAGNSNLAGTIPTSMDANSVSTGLLVTCPDEKLDGELSISNFRLGKFANEPAWPK